MTATIPDPAALAVGDRWTAAEFLELRDALRFLTGQGSNVPPSVQAFNSANISCTTATATLMTLNSETWDTDAMHDTSTNNSRVTLTASGVYRVDFYVQFASNSTGYRRINLRLNAAGSSSGGTSIHTHSIAAANGAATDVARTIERRFSAGDYIELFATQTSGGALDATGGGSTNPYTIGITARWVAA